MKLSFESLQTDANHLLGLVVANYTPTLCVNSYPAVFLRVSFSIHRQVDSHLYKTGPQGLKIWSCPIFNEQGEIEKTSPFVHQVDKKNWVRQCWQFLISLQH